MKLKTFGTIITAASALALCVGASLTTARAAAVWLDLTTPQSIAGHLTIESMPQAPNWQAVQPGQELYWAVTAALGDAPTSTLDLEIYADGALVSTNGMTIEVRSCDVPFSPGSVPNPAPVCTSNQQLVQTTAPLTTTASNFGGSLTSMQVLAQGAPRYLLVTLEIPASVDPLDTVGESARIGIGLHAAGDSPPSTPPPPLVTTGSDVAAIGILAAGGVGLTLGLLLLQRARRASESSRASAAKRALGTEAHA